jgi:hypothetical protein
MTPETEALVAAALDETAPQALQEAPGGVLFANGEEPPVLSVLDNPPPLEGETNAFGAITLDPVKSIVESHSKNFVKIFIYECAGRFYFGYQLKVERIIRQKKANVADTSYDKADAARLAAREEIKGICGSNRFIRDILEDFVSIVYNQPELF